MGKSTFLEHFVTKRWSKNGHFWTIFGPFLGLNTTISIVNSKNGRKMGIFRPYFGRKMVEKRRFPPMKRDSKFAPKTTKMSRNHKSQCGIKLSVFGLGPKG
jgi:hypothetical protein